MLLLMAQKYAWRTAAHSSSTPSAFVLPIAVAPSRQLRPSRHRQLRARPRTTTGVNNISPSPMRRIPVHLAASPRDLKPSQRQQQQHQQQNTEHDSAVDARPDSMFDISSEIDDCDETIVLPGIHSRDAMSTSNKSRSGGFLAVIAGFIPTFVASGASALVDAAEVAGQPGGGEMGARLDAPAAISFGAIAVAFAILQVSCTVLFFCF